MDVANPKQAVWEMTQLIIAPKKVFRNIYYHVSLTEIPQKSPTKAANKIHRNVCCNKVHSDSTCQTND